jgi:HEAT repeats
MSGLNVSVPPDERRLPADCRAVLHGLASANLAHQDAVPLREVMVSMVPSERRAVEADAGALTSRLVGRALERLVSAGHALIDRRCGRKRLYVAKGLEGSLARPVPSPQSRRRRVLRLLETAVADLGVAVRMGELVDLAIAQGIGDELTPELILRDLMNLERTGEVFVAARARSTDGRGLSYYLPASLRAEAGRYQPQIDSFLDDVVAVLGECWQAHVVEADRAGRKPKPFATGEVRLALEAWAATGKGGSTLRAGTIDPQRVANAMQSLAKGRGAVIRALRVRAGERQLLWVPVGVREKDLDLGSAYVSDGDRIVEAARRAHVRTGMPAVRRADVEFEVESDPALAPAGRSSVACILSDASKERLADGKGGRPARVAQRIECVGTVGGHTYYVGQDSNGQIDREPARCFVACLDLELQIERAEIGVRVGQAMECSVNGVSRGRLLLLQREVAEFELAVTSLEREKNDVAATQLVLATVRGKLAAASRDIEGGLTSQPGNGLPDSVDVRGQGWTAVEARKVVAPLYPAVAKATPPRVTALLAKDVRRVRNPAFVSRRSGDPFTATEWLFERTDLLLFAAKQFGGPEARTQARDAEQALGRLRDARFVTPALSSEDVRERLTGVACLAYLTEGVPLEALADRARNDVEPGVRQAALWAYGFAGGEDGLGLLREAATEDQSDRVREFARHALSTVERRGWWKV